LKVKLDSSKNFYVEGLKNVQAKEPKDVVRLLQKAISNRAKTSTEMNEVSSRSHLIVTLTVNTVD
jgi:kinesin family member 5